VGVLCVLDADLPAGDGLVVVVDAVGVGVVVLDDMQVRRRRRGVGLDLEVVGLAGALFERRDRAHPYLVLAARVGRQVIAGRAVRRLDHDRRQLIALHELAAHHAHRRLVAAADAGAEQRGAAGIGHSDVVVAIGEAGGAGMRRSTVEVDLLAVVEDVDVGAAAANVGGEEGARQRRRRRRRGHPGDGQNGCEAHGANRSSDGVHVFISYWYPCDAPGRPFAGWVHGNRARELPPFGAGSNFVYPLVGRTSTVR